MFCQLITAKNEMTTKLLVLIDGKIVSRWHYDDSYSPKPIMVGDLREWEKQDDLSDYQADYDNGVLELDQVLAEQCDLQEFMAEFELESLWFVSHGHPAGCDISEDIHESLSFLGDTSDYWGSVSNSDTWAWDGDSGEPIDERGNKIVNLKAFAKVQE